MRYGDTKGKARRGSKGKAGAKRRLHVSTAQTFSGSSCNRKGEGQGPSSIFDPWLCGRDGHGKWLGDDTQVEIVNAGITEYSRISPWGSGAILPPVTTRPRKPGVPLWETA